MQAIKSRAINMAGEVDDCSSVTSFNSTKQHQLSLEHGLEKDLIDAETARLLRKYCRDSKQRHFSEKEVVQILTELRIAMGHNQYLEEDVQLVKRILCALFLLGVLALAAMGGLAYTVSRAAQVYEVDAARGNALVASGTNTVVSTNSRAQLHVMEPHQVVLNDQNEPLLCVTESQVQEWLDEILEGRNVLLQYSYSQDGDVLEEYRPTFTYVVSQLSGGGGTVHHNGGMCILMPSLQQGEQRWACWQPTNNGIICPEGALQFGSGPLPQV